MSVTIRKDEWLAEVERVLAQRPDGGGHTLYELQEALGMSRNLTLKALHQLQRAGRLTNQRGPRMSLDGVTRMVPTYLIRPLPKSPRR